MVCVFHQTDKGAATIEKTKGGICDPTGKGASPSPPPSRYRDADAIRRPSASKPKVADIAILRIPPRTIAGPIPLVVTVNATEHRLPARGNSELVNPQSPARAKKGGSKNNVFFRAR